MKHRISRLLYTLFSISFCLTTYAQTDSTRISPWFYSVSATGSFRNNEYKEPFGIGYTLPGYRLSGAVGYQKDKWEVSLGGFLLGYFGAQSYPQYAYGNSFTNISDSTRRKNSLPFFRPIFQIKTYIGKEMMVQIGSSDADHQLPDALYNKELRYTAFTEQGVRFMGEWRFLLLDTWVDWQNFIFPRDNHQELFTFGLAASVPFHLSTTQKLTVAVKSIGTHRGGEVYNIQPGESAQTRLAAALGAEWLYMIHPNASIGLSGYGLLSASSQHSRSNGLGIDVTLQGSWKGIDAAIEGWYGSNYYATWSGPFYNALNTASNKTRFMRLSLAYQLYQKEQFGLRLQGDAWLHPGGSFSHAIALYMSAKL